VREYAFALDACIVVQVSFSIPYIGTCFCDLCARALAQQDNKSIPAQATMAYYNKPLTYNSQVAGYLLRTYPSPWTTIDAVSRAVLGTATDDEILVPNTNTPDLRASVKLVQRAVDARAIAARNR